MRTKDAGAHAKEKVPVERNNELEKQLQLMLREKMEGKREMQELKEKLQNVTVKLTEISTRVQELEKAMKDHLDSEGKGLDALSMLFNASSQEAFHKVIFLHQPSCI